jgi:HK97 family phage portal protein
MPSLAREFRDFMSSVISFPADYFAGWFGVAPSESGVEVNELTAMQIAAFVGCVRVLSDAVATTPLNVYERVGDGSERVAQDHYLQPVLRDAFNDEATAADCKQTGQVHCCLTGNAVFEIAYDGAGRPGGLFLRNPFRTIPYRKSDGGLIYKTNDTPGGYERDIEAKNVVHIKGLGMDSLVGLSPVKYYAREVLGGDLAAQSFSNKFFANDSRPGGYLKSTGVLAPDKKLQMAQSWLAGHSRGQAHQMAILDAGVSWEKVGVAPEEAQFLQTREFNRTQIACIFGVPPHFLGEAAESRANMEQRALEFLVFTMRPWFTKWEQALNMRLFPKVGRTANRYYCKFDTTNFERATYADLLKGVQTGRYAGIYTINEGRVLLGEQPYSDEQMKSKSPADKLWMPVNMQWVTDTAENPKPEPIAGQGGNDQDGGDGSGKPASGTTQGGNRSDAEIKKYFAVFYATFRDALGRILARKNTNQSDFERVFSPVLIQIASAFSFRIDSEPGDVTLSSESVAFIRQYCGELAKRAATWSAATADVDAANELRAAIESMRAEVKPNVEEEAASEATN